MNIAMKHTGSSTAACAELGALTGLSIQRTRPGVTPAAPSNEDRVRAFRNARPVVLANPFHWPFQSPADAQPAAASVAASEKPGASTREKNAGNRRLSLVQAA